MFAVIKSNEMPDSDMGTWAGINFNKLVSIVGIGASEDEARKSAIYHYEHETFNGTDSYEKVSLSDKRVNCFVKLSPALEKHYLNAQRILTIDDSELTEAYISASVDSLFLNQATKLLMINEAGQLDYAILVGDNRPYGLYRISDDELKSQLREEIIKDYKSPNNELHFDDF